MSIVARFWTVIGLVVALYLVTVFEAAQNPRLALLSVFVPLLLVFACRAFRCPRCKNPLMKRPSAENSLGYVWKLPTSKTCASCGARL